jgi:hypothetical protein
MNHNRPSLHSEELRHEFIVLVVGALIGLFVGVIVQTVIMQLLGPFPPLPLLLAYYGLLALISVCLLVISLRISQLMRRTEESHSEHDKLHSDTEALRNELRADVKELQSRVGITIKYVDRERDGRGTVYRKAREVVEKAKERIWVLTFINEREHTGAKDEKTDPEIDEYYETLLDRAINGGVPYRRIVQVQAGQTVGQAIQNAGYLKHFHRMLDVQESNPNLQISLQKAPTRRLTTFVLIDSTHLLWQINEILPSGTWQMHGIFIIDDPRREITQHFESFFEAMRSAVQGSIERSELPELPKPK